MRAWIACSAVAALASPALQAPAAAGAAPRTVTIVVDDLKFTAAPPLHVGERVRWVNKDIFRHSATAADHSFDVDLPPGGQGGIVLKRPGVIAYSCRYHPDMKGRLVVAP